MHAGIADVAAAKARMFINKPDGSILFDLFENIGKPYMHFFFCGGGTGWGVSLILGFAISLIARSID